MYKLKHMRAGISRSLDIAKATVVAEPCLKGVGIILYSIILNYQCKDGTSMSMMHVHRKAFTSHKRLNSLVFHCTTKKAH